MSEEIIEICDYNPDWPGMFTSEKIFLQSLIANYISGTIEHVGSTSVVGLAAKPVIDIMVGVESLMSARGAIDILSANGYCYYPYKTDVMHWFCKPKPDIRTHHLHLIPVNSSLWHQRLAFRNHLRNNPLIAAEYCELKRTLAQQYPADRDLYTQKKGPFIQKVLTEK